MNITVIESGKVHKDGSVQGNGRQYAFDPGDGRNLLHCLRELGISVPNDCGGNGRCGKCKVFFPEGAPEATEGDLEKLSTEELDLGYRLACMHAPGEDMVIVIPESGEDAMEILGTQVHTTDAGKPGMTELVASADMGIIRGEETEDLQGDKCPDDNYRFAIDLGTTTVVVALLKGTEAIGTEACVNHQRRFGADVISRIQASMEGKGEALREIILDDLMGAMEKLKERLHLSENCIRQVIIAGNTTMLHLLLGYPCDGLGHAPFKPVTLEMGRDSFDSVFGRRNFNNDGEIAWEVLLFPGFSAFVGADIISGLYFCDMQTVSANRLLVDLGTNGEMALGNKEKIYVTSTAAGPAFEGGNLSCGVGSIPGAVCHVGEDGITTIGDKTPIGLCGTGVIEALAYMKRHGIMDENGLLQGDFFETGYNICGKFGPKVVITQEDIRQVQMAKAAIRAGIEILSLRSGISCEEIDELALAGGFGYYLDTEAAVEIGMLPQEMAGKIRAVGNSSLEGVIRYGREAAAGREEAQEEILKKIQGLGEEISLAEDPLFQEKFLEYMRF